MKKIYNHISTRGLLVMVGLLVAFCGWGQDDRYENVSIKQTGDSGMALAIKENMTEQMRNIILMILVLIHLMMISLRLIHDIRTLMFTSIRFM